MLAVPGTLSLAWESCNPKKKVGKCYSASMTKRMTGVTDPMNQTICMQSTSCGGKSCAGNASGLLRQVKRQAIGGGKGREW